MTAAGTDIELSKTTLAKFAEMASGLEAYPGGSMDSILAQVFEASDLDAYNSIFDGDRGLPVGVEVKIERVRYAPTDYPGGLPFYLVVDAVNLSTGEASEYTVGATTVVGTLVRAAFLDHLPCIGYMYEATKQTKAGLTPYNWKMLAINTPKVSAKNGK